MHLEDSTGRDRVRFADFRPLSSGSLDDFLVAVPDPVLLLTTPGRFPSVQITVTGVQRGVPKATVPDTPDRRDFLVLPVRKKGGTLSAEIWIGRAATCDVILSFDTISRVHAVIGRTPQGLMTISDVGSKNGTYLNGKRLEKGEAHVLEDDALLMLGDLELTFLLPETFYGELKSPR